MVSLAPSYIYSANNNIETAVADIPHAGTGFSHNEIEFDSN